MLASLGLVFVFVLVIPAHADRLILRDLSRVTGFTIESMDEDGVTLSNGQQVGWDSVENGEIDESRQGEFDRLLAEFGTPLFRIRNRLRLGDNHALGELAEPLYDRYKNRSSESALIVCLATMRGRIATGNRVDALVPYFDVLRILKSLGDASRLTATLEEFQFSVDMETGLSREFLPVWYDRDEASRAIETVQSSFEERKAVLPPASILYVASMAASAGDYASAEKLIDEARPVTQELLELIELSRWQVRLFSQATTQTTELRSNLDKLLPRNRAIALYWLGVSGLTSETPELQREAMLDLLRIPAELGQFSELAAAGLYHVHSGLGGFNDESGQQNIEREMLARYPDSIFAARLRDEGR